MFWNQIPEQGCLGEIWSKFSGSLAGWCITDSLSHTTYVETNKATRKTFENNQKMYLMGVMNTNSRDLFLGEYGINTNPKCRNWNDLNRLVTEKYNQYQSKAQNILRL